MAKPKVSAFKVLLLLYIFFNLNLYSAVRHKITNLQCVILDPTVSSFTVCKLKVLKRGVVGLNLNIELHKKLTNCKINVGLYKKANGYKPFLQNYTIDLCSFVSGRKGQILHQIFMNFIQEFSNLNHSCPYEGNIFVKDLILTSDKFKLVPFPTGEYLDDIYFIVNGKAVSYLKVYFSRTED